MPHPDILKPDVLTRCSISHTNTAAVFGSDSFAHLDSITSISVHVTNSEMMF